MNLFEVGKRSTIGKMNFLAPEPMQNCETSEGGIFLGSESHTSLFLHDDELLNHFRAQFEAVNEHTTSLEEKVRTRSEECNLLRNRLYESEITRHHESEAQTALQSHLRIEQGKHNECVRAYQTLERRQTLLGSDLKAANTYNEMLRQEVERNQRIIESMATKLSMYEEAGGKHVEASKVLSQPRKDVPEGEIAPTAHGASSIVLAQDGGSSRLDIEAEIPIPVSPVLDADIRRPKLTYFATARPEEVLQRESPGLEADVKKVKKSKKARRTAKVLKGKVK